MHLGYRSPPIVNGNAVMVFSEIPKGEGHSISTDVIAIYIDETNKKCNCQEHMIKVNIQLREQVSYTCLFGILRV